MGCNVSKDHQVDQQGGGENDGVAIKSAKSKNKKGSSKKSSVAETIDANCVNEDHNKKTDLSKTENGTAEGEKEDEDMNLDPADPSLNAAAAKIQASFRGHKVRKELKKTADEIDLPTPKEEDCSPTAEDVDLNDPDVEKAATKIQASFRGYMVRKQGKDGSNSPTSENPGS